MKRLQFVVQDDVYHSLENLREKTGSTSLAEVFRDAIRAYTWIVSEFERGREVVSRPLESASAEEVYSPLRAASPLLRQGHESFGFGDAAVERARELFDEQTQRLASAFEAGRAAMKTEGASTGTLSERLIAENDEFRKLHEEYKKYDQELAVLGGRDFLSPDQQWRVGELKKLKLVAKDRMEAILRHARATLRA